MDEALATVPRFIASTGLLVMFPKLSKFFFDYSLFGFGALKNAINDVRGYIVAQVKEHESTLDNNNPRDYIDSFLIEQKERKNKNIDLESFTREFEGSIICL